MRGQSTGPLLSTVFIDYDNIYQSLKRKSDEAAKRFAKDVSFWLSQIESGQLITATNQSRQPQNRQLILNRCYGNPVPRRNNSDNSTDMSSFPFVRHHFLRAGLEIIDCPPLTSQLKNSADIRIVMDVNDLMNHQTRFDEFIILSGDADFTPLLYRLRAHARRTVVYVNDLTAAPYAAIADGEIRETDLLDSLLEGREDLLEEVASSETSTTAPPSSPLSGPQIEAIRGEIVSNVVSWVQNAGHPLALDNLAERVTRTLGHERTLGTGWAGMGTLSSLLHKGLPPTIRVSGQAPYFVYDISLPVGAESSSRSEDGFISQSRNSKTEDASEQSRQNSPPVSDKGMISSLQSSSVKADPVISPSLTSANASSAEASAPVTPATLSTPAPAAGPASQNVSSPPQNSEQPGVQQSLVQPPSSDAQPQVPFHLQQISFAPPSAPSYPSQLSQLAYAAQLISASHTAPPPQIPSFGTQTPSASFSSQPVQLSYGIQSSVAPTSAQQQHPSYTTQNPAAPYFVQPQYPNYPAQPFGTAYPNQSTPNYYPLHRQVASYPTQPPLPNFSGHRQPLPPTSPSVAVPYTAYPSHPSHGSTQSQSPFAAQPAQTRYPTHRNQPQTGPSYLSAVGHPKYPSRQEFPSPSGLTSPASQPLQPAHAPQRTSAHQSAFSSIRSPFPQSPLAAPPLSTTLPSGTQKVPAMAPNSNSSQPLQQSHTSPVPTAPAPAKKVSPEASAAIQKSITRIQNACQVPALAPPEYRILFDVMAQEITANGLTGAQTLANISQRAAEQNVKIRRDDIRFVLEVVSEADPWFEQGASADVFSSRFRNYVITSCRNKDLQLTSTEIDLIDTWFGGELDTEEPSLGGASNASSSLTAPLDSLFDTSSSDLTSTAPPQEEEKAPGLKRGRKRA